jgi:hypothetical protein
MTCKIDLFNLSSTYVVLRDDGEAAPIAVSDRFFEDLERKFRDFKGKRLMLGRRTLVFSKHELAAPISEII